MIVKYKCLICGIDCTKRRSPGNIKTSPKFCSQKCSGIFKTINKKGPTINFSSLCIYCGKKFKTYCSPSRLKNNKPKFCSLICLGKYQKGSNNPSYNGGKHIQNGYMKILVTHHPNCDVRGYVYEHRFIMECKLGRYLKKREIVHHIDEDKLNNNPNNLRLFKNQSEHLKFHAELNKTQKQQLLPKMKLFRNER